MKSNIFKWVTLALLCVGSSSCEDFLTQENPYASSADDFWSNISECNQSVTSIYAALRNEAVLQTHYEAFRADLAWPAAGRPVPENNGDEYMCYVHSYNNTTEFIQEKWEACYEGIFRANQAIRGLNGIKSSLTEDTEMESWVELMAQARFFRGLFHFYLHSAFNNGEIIIIDEIPIEIEDFYLPVSPSDEVIAFFRSDLQYAYENLPIAYEDTADLGRVTSGAAATILGTSYLYEFSEKGDSEKLDSAMELFRYVIDDCGYELIQSHLDLFTEANEMNSESIFEIVYSSTIQPELSLSDPYNFIQTVGFYSARYNDGHLLPAWLANAYQSESIDPNNPRNEYTQITDDEESIEIRTMMPLRASAMVGLWEDIYTPYYLSATVPESKQGAKMNYTTYGFGFYRKYSGCMTMSDDERESGMNIMVNRLSEVYMMYVECLIEKNDITAALKYLNIIRERWGLVLLGPDLGDGFTYDGKSYDQASLMTQLREVDKPLECSLEGHMMRWIDLRRWGMLESNFKKLSEATYYAVNGTVTTASGVSKSTTKNCIVRNEVQYKSGTATGITVDFEYDTPYNNFKYEDHAYYPIPMSELETNPNIFK